MFACVPSWRLTTDERGTSWSIVIVHFPCSIYSVQSITGMYPMYGVLLVTYSVHVCAQGMSLSIVILSRTSYSQDFFPFSFLLASMRASQWPSVTLITRHEKTNKHSRYICNIVSLETELDRLLQVSRSSDTTQYDATVFSYLHLLSIREGHSLFCVFVSRNTSPSRHPRQEEASPSPDRVRVRVRVP